MNERLKWAEAMTDFVDGLLDVAMICVDYHVSALMLFEEYLCQRYWRIVRADSIPQEVYQRLAILGESSLLVKDFFSVLKATVGRACPPPMLETEYDILSHFLWRGYPEICHRMRCYYHFTGEGDIRISKCICGRPLYPPASSR